MRIYNTLTKKTDYFEPISKDSVSIYTCGPTVYDYPHIGNWFSFIRYDQLVRTLKILGYKTKWVINITDVGHLVSDSDEGQDKLEKGAQREGKNAWDIANFYSNYFVKSLERLNFLKPDHLPRATEHIKEQVKLIKELEDKGYTYIIDDGVYFDTSRFKGYSKLAKLQLEDQQAGYRVALNPQKKNNSDFALWKFSPINSKRDMEWESPWGNGFPGWHIECSAMIKKYLGDTIDIHSGGIEHIPTHHTNEIAQSEAATGKPLANYWVHNNHILIEGTKISKSLGNGATLEEIEKKGYSLEALRLLVLQSSYRKQSHFSWAILDDASNSLRHLRSDFSWVYNAGFKKVEPLETLPAFFENYRIKILEALANDLDSTTALTLLHEAGSKFSALTATSADGEIVESFAKFIDEALGIKILVKLVLNDKQKKLLEERELARKNKNWIDSDKLRAELNSAGIGVRDTPDGTIWYPE